MSDKRAMQIDEEGYWLNNGVRVTDNAYGADLLKTLTVDERGTFAAGPAGEQIVAEPFDEPLVVRVVERAGDKLIGQMPYQWTIPLDLSTFSVDDWDRFHGRTANGVPYVLSRAAQAALFDAVDEFDDTSLTFNGKQYEMNPWMQPNGGAEGHNFWTDIYREHQKANDRPNWEIGKETPILHSILPQLKVPRARVAVLGCGSGDDAAYLARAGHIVTGIDYSEEAVAEAQKKFGKVKDLKFIKSDIFALPKALHGQFDIVFEHTCYCAVNPARRNQLVQIWRNLLAERGHLLGIFFVMDKRNGPPWGSSEWELRERLRKGFDFRYWTRWKASVPKREGTELVVWAQKKD